MIKITEKEASKLPYSSSLFVEFNYKKEIVDILKTCDVFSYDNKTHIWEVPITSLHKLLDNLYTFDNIELNLLPDKKPKKQVDIKLPKYKIPLYKHQEEAVKFALSGMDKWLLLDDPGLGKSSTIIHIAEELLKAKKIEHALIICGFNILKTNWEKEIHKHSDLTCRILGKKISKTGKVNYGSIPERLIELKNKIEEQIIIINVESLRNEEIVKAINSGPNKFDLVVFDELQVLSSPSSQQAKGLLKIKSKYKIGATGTLLTSSPLNAYVPLKWIEAEHGTFTNFKYYFCRYGGPFKTDLIGYKHLDILQDQINEHSLRRKKELLDLPEKTIIDEYVDMDKAQEDFYLDIVNGIVSEADKVELKPAAVLSMVTRLREVTACPTILTTSNISSAKIDRACELVKEILSNNEKVVIFSMFKETLNVLMDKLSFGNPVLCTGDVKDDIVSKNIDNFQNDDIHKILLAVPKRLGAGVTLTRANYGIFIDVPWTMAEFQQAQDRIHRIGSNKKVFIYHLITNNTVDERVKEIVYTKGAISDYIVDSADIPPQLMGKLRNIIEELK